MGSDGFLLFALACEKRWRKHRHPVISAIIRSRSSPSVPLLTDPFVRVRHSMTAMDTLGRMENKHAYSAANAFKFDQWHSMFMPREHDISKLTFEQLRDVYTLAWTW